MTLLRIKLGFFLLGLSVGVIGTAVCFLGGR